MAHAAFLIALLPLLGAVLILLNGRTMSDKATGTLATAAVTGSLAATVWAFVLYLNHEVTSTVHLFTWFSVGGLNVPAAFQVDALSLTMCLFITGISALIHLYSMGYMAGDTDYRKFFLYLNLFVFSMLLLVLANNLVVTFVGWEGVGVCSYWLVSYYFDRESAASAGKKAFLYNRVGDLGLLAAMFLLYTHLHTLTYTTIFASLSQLSGTTATLIVLSLLLAAAGKSAQIPLFNWLPDAMEGPTPVSALIHAATMVTAGVFLLVRMSPVLALSSDGRSVIAIVGALTAFVTATIATSQKDIKKVLAFSTVSQIGYMVLAVGVGAYGAAIFLMVAHAFFKALLFLGSGSVIHALNGEQDLRKMGGLRKYLPLTFPTFLIGWLAISGVPPFAGFWAKGAILTSLYAHNKVLYALALLTAVLTAYYMTRLFVLTFRGEERFVDVMDGAAPHESPLVMTAPLVILGVLAAVGGALDLPWLHAHTLETFLAPTFGAVPAVAAQSSGLQITLAGVDVIAALIGLGAGVVLWRQRSSAPSLEPSFLENVWYWDEGYDRVIGRPLTGLAAISGSVVEETIIDGGVRGVVTGVQRLSREVRKVQTGFVRHYALAMVLGLAFIVLYLVARVG